MTVFDLFQRATCEISEGKNRAAMVSLNKAINKINAGETKGRCREDLVELRALLIQIGV